MSHKACSIALIGALVLAVAACGSDETSSSDTQAATTTVAPEPTTTVAEPTTTVAPESTTTVAPESTTTVAPESTSTVAPEPTTTVAEPTTVPSPDAVTIAPSPLQADLVRADPSEHEMPFVDGEVQAHWYQSGGTYVVVYAGWGSAAGEPQCPGSSIYTPGGEFAFISNSPQVDGVCEPADRYPLIIPIDDPLGVRVCGPLVLNHTIIPVTNDDGSMRDGEIYATVERIVDNGWVSSYGSVAINGVVVPELDTTAAAYSVPEGWLPGGATTATC